MRVRPGNLAKIAAVALLSVCLAGCLSSKRPLFGEAQAVAALGDGGRYQTWERTDSGGYKREERVSVRRTGKVYEFTDARGVSTTVSFHPLTEGRFAGQILSGGGDYAYVMMRMEGRVAYMHAADCEKQDKEKLAALGVEFRNRQCLLDKVTDPQALFAALEFGPPTSKMGPLGAERRRRHSRR